MEAQEFVNTVTDRVNKADRKVWWAMDKAGVASYSYLRYLVAGRYKDVGIMKITKIAEFLDKHEQAA